MTTAIDGLRRKVVTMDDISQLRHSFHALEGITHENISALNVVIRDLEAELGGLRQTLEQSNRDFLQLNDEVDRAKTLVDPEATEYDLLEDLVEREQAVINEELARKDDQINGAVRQLDDWDDDRADIRRRIEAARHDYENLKRTVYHKLDGGTGPATRSGSMRGGSMRGGSVRGGSVRSYRGAAPPLASTIDDAAVDGLLETRLAEQQNYRFVADQRLSQMEDQERALDDAIQDRQDYLHVAQSELGSLEAQLQELSRRADNPRIWQSLRHAPPPASRASAPAGNVNAFIDQLRERDQVIADELRGRDQELHEVGSRVQYLRSGVIDDELHALRQDEFAVRQSQQEVDRELARLREYSDRHLLEEQRRADQGRSLDDVRRDLDARLNEVMDANHRAARDYEKVRGDVARAVDEHEHWRRQYQLREDDQDEQQRIMDHVYSILTALSGSVDERYKQVEYITAKLMRVEDERRQKHEMLRKYKSDELSLLDEPAPGIGADGRPLPPGHWESNIANERIRQSQAEMQRLFQSTRQNLQVVSEKAYYSYAALRTKDDLDSLYHQELNVTGAEMILRDEKIRLLFQIMEFVARNFAQIWRILREAGVTDLQPRPVPPPPVHVPAPAPVPVPAPLPPSPPVARAAPVVVRAATPPSPLYTKTPSPPPKATPPPKVREAPIVQQPPTVVLEPLRIDGVAMEGEPLTCSGWWVDTDMPGCTFEWASRVKSGSFKAIAGASARQYIPTVSDVDHEVRCKVTRKSEEATAYTLRVRLSPPTVLNIKVQGGQFHTQPIVVKCQYKGGVEGESKIQWYRSLDNGPYYAIPAATTPIYQPTCDDLPAVLRVDYTPVRSDGVVGTTVATIVPAEYQQIDPEVAKSVQGFVEKGETAFDVMLIGPPDEPRTLSMNRSQIAVRKGGRTKARTAWNAHMRAHLHPTDPKIFTLTLSDRHRFTFSVANIRQRDVVVLTIRSFQGIQVLKNDRRGVHRVESLEELQKSRRRGG